MVNRDSEFFGFFDRCDGLIYYWSKYQACFVFIFYPIFPFIFIYRPSIGILIWLSHAFLLTILAFIGFFKAKLIKKIFTRASKVVSRHPNKDLVKMFKKTPKIIRTILVLELFLALTWIVSFPLKFLFYKNMNGIKSLIIDCKNLD